MSRARVWLVSFVIALLAALPLAAQVQTGSILVRVTDEQGGAVPGVTVTLSSPVLVAGTMTGVTDTGGVNRFPSLNPGTYSVKLDLQGFRTVIREGIIVVVGQTVPIDLSLQVATVAETVTVTGASPVVDTTSANTSVNLSEQLLQGTPGGRDIWSLVEYKVPSLLITRPDVGGTSGGLQGVFNARGTTSAQNSSYLNGINVGDPAAIGAAGFYYDFDAFEDIQVSTGAHDITVPTSGVFLNMVTKSGGEPGADAGRLPGWVTRRRRRTSTTNLLRYGFRPETNSVDFVSDINVSAGGPVIAKKAADVRIVPRLARARQRARRVFDTRPRPDEHHVRPGQRQLSDERQQSADRASTRGSTTRSPTGCCRRRIRSFRNRRATKTTSSTSTRCCGTRWSRQKFFIDARVGLNKIFFPTYLNGNDQTLIDSATGIRTRNFNAGTERWRDRYQANATGQYYIDQALGGRHELKFGFDHAHSPVENRVSRFDDVDPTYSSATGLSQNVILYGTPFFTKTAVNVTALYAQDSYRDQAADRDRRPTLRAPRGLPARTGQPGEPLLPEPCALVARGPRRRELEHDGTHGSAPRTT